MTIKTDYSALQKEIIADLNTDLDALKIKSKKKKKKRGAKLPKKPVTQSKPATEQTDASITV